ncbi:MAG: hypothetical protein ACK45U_08540 [bacterium]|jgi:hypothetical protein
MKAKISMITLILVVLNLSSYANSFSDTLTTDSNKQQVEVQKAPVNTLPVAKAAPKIVEPLELSGPRIGFTFIGAGSTADALKTEFNASPFITQFGWQFEKQYFALDNGTAGLVEFVGLIGGLEQGLFLPSANMLVGVRSSSGAEFAFGPNISISGAAFVLAVGHTYKSGNLNFPVNFAVVPSSKGVRFSLLFGFNAQTR